MRYLAPVEVSSLKLLIDDITDKAPQIFKQIPRGNYQDASKANSSKLTFYSILKELYDLTYSETSYWAHTDIEIQRVQKDEDGEMNDVYVSNLISNYLLAKVIQSNSKLNIGMKYYTTDYRLMSLMQDKEGDSFELFEELSEGVIFEDDSNDVVISLKRYILGLYEVTLTYPNFDIMKLLLDVYGYYPQFQEDQTVTYIKRLLTVPEEQIAFMKNKKAVKINDVELVNIINCTAQIVRLCYNNNIVITPISTSQIDKILSESSSGFVDETYGKAKAIHFRNSHEFSQALKEYDLRERPKLIDKSTQSRFEIVNCALHSSIIEHINNNLVFSQRASGMDADSERILLQRSIAHFKRLGLTNDDPMFFKSIAEHSITAQFNWDAIGFLSYNKKPVKFTKEQILEIFPNAKGLVNGTFIICKFGFLLNVTNLARIEQYWIGGEQ